MKGHDNFIDVPFTVENLDRFNARKSILRAITNALPSFSGRLLDAGCGKMPYKLFILKNSRVSEYVGLDIEGALVYDKNVSLDFTWDGKVMPFQDSSFDCVMATEVLEHCPEPDVFLKEVYRVLKPQGLLFFTVPFLWNLHEVPHDEYRYTPFALERHLGKCAFKNINIRALGGWHASMAQMLGLWVKRAPMPKLLRGSLSLLIKPVMFYLLQADRKYDWRFKEGLMITGLAGTATKE